MILNFFKTKVFQTAVLKRDYPSLKKILILLK